MGAECVDNRPSPWPRTPFQRCHIGPSPDPFRNINQLNSLIDTQMQVDRQTRLKRLSTREIQMINPIFLFHVLLRRSHILRRSPSIFPFLKHTFHSSISLFFFFFDLFIFSFFFFIPLIAWRWRRSPSTAAASAAWRSAPPPLRLSLWAPTRCQLDSNSIPTRSTGAGPSTAGGCNRRRQVALPVAPPPMEPPARATRRSNGT